MMASSNGNIFRVTGPLQGKSSGHNGQWRGALMFSLICGWANTRDTGDLRRHRTHYDVTVMIIFVYDYYEAWLPPPAMELQLLWSIKTLVINPCSSTLENEYIHQSLLYGYCGTWVHTPVIITQLLCNMITFFNNHYTITVEHEYIRQ